MQLVFSQSKTQKTLSFFWCISHGPSHPIVCLLPVLLQTGDWHRRCCILIRKAGRHPLSPVMSLFWQLLMMFLFLFLFLVTVANPVVQPCSAETLLLWTYRDLGSKMRKTNQTIPFACGLSELSIGINRELDFCSSCQLSWGWGLHTSGVYCSNWLSSVGLVPHGMYIQEPFSLAYLWDLFLTGTGDHWFLNETSWDCEKEKFFDMMVWSWIMDHVGYGSLHIPTKQLGGHSSNTRHQFKRIRHKLLDIQEK